MKLGNDKYFTKENFEKNKGHAPAYLSELVVYCLELVSQLSHHNLQYRFKGGNSLLVMLENPQRFSIDVDIATKSNKEELIKLVDTITNENEFFTKYEIRQHKTKPWLPMISFKLYFNSFYQDEENAYIMLDAILENAPYAGIKKQVRCLDMYQSNELVEVPTIEGLIADKLLTIGPSTLGIPLGKNKEGHRLKHVFDISLLSKHELNIEQVKVDLKNCIQQENGVQRKNLSQKEIFDDTIDFCSQALKYDRIPALEGIEDNQYLYEIVKGFEEFKEHLFKMDYTWNLLKNDFQNIINLISKI